MSAMHAVCGLQFGDEYIRVHNKPVCLGLTRRLGCPISLHNSFWTASNLAGVILGSVWTFIEPGGGKKVVCLQWERSKSSRSTTNHPYPHISPRWTCITILNMQIFLQAPKTLGYTFAAPLTPYCGRYEPTKLELVFSLNPKDPNHPLHPLHPLQPWPQP